MEDDANLVREAVGGSLPAFTAIFARYEAQVHDVAFALLRDRKAALEVVNATFSEASERLEYLQEPDRLLVWLLAITRFQAGLVADDTAGRDRQPELGDEDPERARLVGLVWEATADMPLRERAIIDLSLRQGLEGEDLADALGVGPAEADDLQARMADLEKGLAGYLITCQDERPCPDLPLVLRGWDGHFTPGAAGGISAHVSSCRVCERSRSGLPSPFALYASVRPLPLPHRDEILPANVAQEVGG